MDDYSTFFHVLFIFIAAMTTLISIDYLRRENMNHAEYYALLLFATAGMLVMAGSNELMMIFIGLEILSIGTYVMAGFRRTDLRSNESALKYFLLGSFASAFFLYGVALIFGAAGSTNLISISAAMTRPDIQLGLVYLSAALMLIALCFKVAVAPFHIWAPDVYEGAPTPITGFMSVGPKAAGFAVLFRIFVTAFPADSGSLDRHHWGARCLDHDSRQRDRGRSAQHQEDAGLFVDRPCRIHRRRLRGEQSTAEARPLCSTRWPTLR